MVVAVLKAGADVNAKGTDGQTALMYASSRGHKNVVSALLEAGADVNANTHDGKSFKFLFGKSARDFASSRPDIVKLLDDHASKAKQEL